MAVAPDSKSSGFDIVRMVVWSGAGVILAWVGVQTAGTMQNLAQEVQQLRIALVRLEARVEKLPPPDLTYRIAAVERGLEKCEQHFQAGNHNGK